MIIGDTPALDGEKRSTAAAARAVPFVTSPGLDVLPPEMARLHATARREIDRHLNTKGTCASCQRPWPCATACLAEFTLGAL